MMKEKLKIIKLEKRESFLAVTAEFEGIEYEGLLLKGVVGDNKYEQDTKH